MFFSRWPSSTTMYLWRFYICTLPRMHGFFALTSTSGSRTTRDPSSQSRRTSPSRRQAQRMRMDPTSVTTSLAMRTTYHDRMNRTFCADIQPAFSQLATFFFAAWHTTQRKSRDENGHDRLNIYTSKYTSVISATLARWKFDVLADRDKGRRQLMEPISRTRVSNWSAWRAVQRSSWRHSPSFLALVMSAC